MLLLYIKIFINAPLITTVADVYMHVADVYMHVTDVNIQKMDVTYMFEGTTCALNVPD
jgi:hypothetical protein